MGTAGEHGLPAGLAQLCHLGQVMPPFSVLELCPFIQSLPLTCLLVPSDPICH